MYINGAIVPVPSENREEYRAMADKMADMFMARGAIQTMDAWEVEVPGGDVTDMRRAVSAKEGEMIVFAWMIWPDKETCDKAMADMNSDPAMAEFGAPPFDGKRAIFGGFEPIVTRDK